MRVSVCVCVGVYMRNAVNIIYDMAKCRLDDPLIKTVAKTSRTSGNNWKLENWKGEHSTAKKKTKTNTTTTWKKKKNHHHDKCVRKISFSWGPQRNTLHKLWRDGEKLSPQLAKRNLSTSFIFLSHRGTKLEFLNFSLDDLYSIKHLRWKWEHVECRWSRSSIINKYYRY